MMFPQLRSHQHFRRRLAFVCVLVAALSAGFLAIGAYLIAGQYRSRSFAAQATHRVALAQLALARDDAPSQLTAALELYAGSAGFEWVAVDGDRTYTSTRLAVPGLRALPANLRAHVAADSAPRRITVAGQPYLVIARPAPAGAAEIYYFFGRAGMLRSVHDFGVVLLGAWFATVLLAASLGSAVARRVLRPVRVAAESSHATAARLLGRELTSRDDEFDQWIDAYNDLVAQLERHVAEVSAVADRERRFTSDVAHELRTPLTGMVSAAALLEDEIDALPASARRPAELMIADVRRLRQLVGELLELARIDARAEPVLVEPIDVTLALEAVLHTWFSEIDVRCEVTPGLRACADRARFKRVVTNLIENAVRHGRPPVIVRAFGAGDVVRIEVVDAGPGIDRKDAERIFDRFYKADAGRAGRGSGLGLAIAFEHASAFGAGLALANPGEPGACFVVTLPTTESTAANEPIADHGSAESRIPA